MKGPYQDFIFDLYGTLVDIRTDEEQQTFWQKMAMYFSYNGAVWTPADLRVAYHGVVKAHLAARTYTRWPDTPVEAVYTELYQARGIQPSQEILAQTARVWRLTSTEYLFPYAETFAVLAELRTRGKGVHLLSNAQGGFTRPELQALGLDACLDTIFISSEQGRSKPDPVFLQALMDSAGIDPATAIMTGNDLTTDVEVARSAGVASAYLHTNHSRAEWLVAAPTKATHVIADGRLSALLALT